ncbi:hypothetical protein [Paraburkholderia unamae]|uniref:hypothetical protein n=1 Tax=Paraburkholderia unamae TaxID=219649 RepID=UPI000DC575C9|nr:hypothetical protein [Paraburkholderia unamae]RAR66801.1 hypothetical protein C7401_102226 [Paraburkholderia unamae]
MLYFINALGGLGRSVTGTARLAFAKAGASSRWRKLALYAAMFALPGGSLAVVAMELVRRRRARQASASATGAVAPAVAAAATLAPACGGGQLACRAQKRRRNDA